MALGPTMIAYYMSHSMINMDYCWACSTEHTLILLLYPPVCFASRSFYVISIWAWYCPA